MTSQQSLKRGKSTDGLAAVSDAPPGKVPKATSVVGTPSATVNPEDLKKQILLNIAPQRPKIPSPPNFDESVMGINGNAMNAKAKSYFDEVQLCSQYYVTEWVMKPISEGGLNILKPLWAIPPLKISDNQSSGWGLTTFCETWDENSCSIALRSTALYEAPGSIWWVSRKANTVQLETGEKIVFEAIYSQFESARSFFTDLAYNSSNHSEPDKRRYFFPGFLPTCITGSVAVEEDQGRLASFTDLPLFAAHGIVLAYDEAILHAVYAGNHEKAKKLFQAGLSVYIRMHLNPSPQNQVSASLKFAEVIRMQKLACKESLWDFVGKLVSLPGMKEAIRSSVPKTEKACEAAGITYRGKKIENNMAKTIVAMEPFATSGAVRDAFADLGTLTNDIDEASKIMRFCQVTAKKAHNREEGINFLVFFARLLIYSLRTRKCVEDDLKRDMLIGTKHKCGFVHVAHKKFEVVTYLRESVKRSLEAVGNASLQEEIQEKVLPGFENAEIMGRRLLDGIFNRDFDKIENQSLVGEKLTEQQNQNHKTWIVDLQPGAAKFADLLFGIFLGSFDEVFLNLAVKDFAAAGNQPLWKYFDSDDPDDKYANTLLKGAFNEFKKVLAQMVAGNAVTPEDSTQLPSDMLIVGAPEEQTEEKEELWQIVLTHRKRLVNFIAASSAADNIKAALTKAFTSSKVYGLASKGRRKKLLFLLNAACFTSPTPSKHDACAVQPGETMSSNTEFNACLDWMSSNLKPQDMAMVFSGRNKCVQEDVEKWQKEAKQNHKGTHNAIDAWLIFSEKKVSKNDPRLPARKHAMERQTESG